MSFHRQPRLPLQEHAVQPGARALRLGVLAAQMSSARLVSADVAGRHRHLLVPNRARVRPGAGHFELARFVLVCEGRASEGWETKRAARRTMEGGARTRPAPRPKHSATRAPAVPTPQHPHEPAVRHFPAPWPSFGTVKVPYVEHQMALLRSSCSADTLAALLARFASEATAA